MAVVTMVHVIDMWYAWNESMMKRWDLECADAKKGEEENKSFLKKVNQVSSFIRRSGAVTKTLCDQISGLSFKL